MNTITWIIIGIVVLVLLIIVIRFLKGCLPKIVIGLIILGGLAYFAYNYFIK
jgi:hypothetical protein